MQETSIGILENAHGKRYEVVVAIPCLNRLLTYALHLVFLAFVCVKFDCFYDSPLVSLARFHAGFIFHWLRRILTYSAHFIWRKLCNSSISIRWRAFTHTLAIEIHCTIYNSWTRYLVYMHVMLELRNARNSCHCVCKESCYTKYVLLRLYMQVHRYLCKTLAILVHILLY